MQRIAKFIAASGLCSRRDAEKMILESRVIVNGELIHSPALNVTDQDIISVDGRSITLNNKQRLWLYHKPKGLVTTHKDPECRPTVFSMLKDLPRVISVGRLDLNSEGLLLLTNSGELARKMELPSSGIERIYKVRARPINSSVKKDGLLNAASQKIVIDDIIFSPKEISLIRAKQSSEHNERDNDWYKVVLASGKNREIRKIFNFFGFEVSRLIRISYGKYELGNIKPGEYVEIDI